MRAVFGQPECGGFFEGVGGHAACEGLGHEVAVGRGGDHEFDFGVEFGLRWGVEGDGEFGFGAGFGGRF